LGYNRAGVLVTAIGWWNDGPLVDYRVVIGNDHPSRVVSVAGESIGRNIPELTLVRAL